MPRSCRQSFAAWFCCDRTKFVAKRILLPSIRFLSLSFTAYSTNIVSPDDSFFFQKNMPKKGKKGAGGKGKKGKGKKGSKKE